MYLLAFREVFQSPTFALVLHRRLRDRLPAQDQRDQRLCRLDRLVELLLAADPQPPGPRRVAGVQRAAGAAADGDRHLPLHREHPRIYANLRGGLDRRADRRPRHQQAARLEPDRHRVQARASLRHQSRRRRRMLAATIAGIAARYRRASATTRNPVAVSRARRRIRYGARHRLGHQGALLPCAQAKRTGAACRSCAARSARHQFETDDMAHVPGVLRPDLLAVLHARGALPRLCKPQGGSRSSSSLFGRVLPDWAMQQLNTESDATSASFCFSAVSSGRSCC